MRYCPYCRRLNPGHPIICHYCGRTWNIRLCPRNHENPPNAQHCGTCGSTDLSETAGPKPAWTYLVKAFVIVILWIDAYLIFKIVVLLISEAIFLNFALIITLLVAADQVALSVLPQPVKGIITRINQLVIRNIKRLMLNFIQKVKELINLILNW